MHGDSFEITGLSGKKLLHGSIPVYGSKNAALPVMAAASLIEGESRLANVPEISDVSLMGKILEALGAYVSRSGSGLSVSAKDLSGTVMPPEFAKSMRASILLIGPMLARLGRVTFPHPGGDVIGERPIDIFVSGFTKLGAIFSETSDTYTLSASNGLSGGEFFMRTVSVTATETFMMAATRAKGPVTLKNCAMEPEVIATAEFLRASGADISGAGTPTIYIRPSVLSAPEKVFAIIPDRIEAATFLALGALSAKELTITGIDPSHLDAVFDMLSAMGVPFSISKDSIVISAPEALRPVKLRTHEYPGFPTDAQAPMTIL
ncbi:MAG: UDP-N-acetylglucosamine 1-carboxyvinyltransferase, partial [Patescibacteria group bacterium]|nr:UDP-N-acetylglucosamine 1-carboxyvinyltransferase [Patescibacteria group bacterium]